MTRVVKYATGLFLALAAIWAVFTVAMRKKCPPLQNALRRMARDVVNPEQMKTAGQPGAYASVIKHHGRKSGTAYETPVQARATEDGFVIPLPYGHRADWLKNVMAEGSATLINEGETFLVDHPEFVPSSVAEPYIRPKDLRSQRVYGVDEYLQVRRVQPAEAQDEVAEPV